MGGNINLNQTTFAGVLSALTIDADKDFGGFNITNLGAGGHDLNTKLGYLDQDVKIAASPTFVGLTLSGLTKGSVLFAGAGGIISQDNANLFWDNVNNRLGIGTAIPSQALDLLGAFELEDTTTPTTGVIYKGANRFIHNFHHPTGGPPPGGAVPVGHNTFIGERAGNFTMGSTATLTTHGSYNIGLGYIALFGNTTGRYNIAIGSRALYTNTSGYFNMAIGTSALRYNTIGLYNTAIGVNVLLHNINGNYNAGIGSESLRYNESGDYNIAIGYGAGYGLAGLSDVSNNIFIGHLAGYAVLTGADNNVLIGYQAGDSITTGASNIMIGIGTDPVNPTDSNKLNIGNTIYGDLSAGNVGIGTTLPQGKLHVGDQATNYLKVAADGEVGLVGTARVERHWLIDPARFRLPAANYPAESFEGLFYTLDFDKSTDESAYCEEHVPYRWDSSTDIEVEVWWLHDSVDAGVVVWGIEYLSIKEDETVGAAGTTITQASAGNHTAGELQKTTFTTKILHANLETHDAIAIRLFRDADNGSDTLNEDARVINVCFHFIMNKLGQAT